MTQLRNKDVNKPGNGGEFAGHTNSSPEAGVPTFSEAERAFTREASELYRRHREERHAMLASAVPALTEMTRRQFPGAERLGVNVTLEDGHMFVEARAVELSDGSKITDHEQFDALSGDIDDLLSPVVHYADDLEVIANVHIEDGYGNSLYGIALIPEANTTK